LVELIDAAVPIGPDADLHCDRWPRGSLNKVKWLLRHARSDRRFDPAAEANERRVCASANIAIRNPVGSG